MESLGRKLPTLATGDNLCNQHDFNTSDLLLLNVFLMTFKRIDKILLSSSKAFRVQSSDVSHGDPFETRGLLESCVPKSEPPCNATNAFVRET